MYQERQFNTWQEGLIYIIIVVLIPLVPIVVGLWSNISNNYYYVLIFTSAISIGYDFFKKHDKVLSKMLSIERIIGGVFNAIIIVWAFVMLTFVSSTKSSDSLKTSDYVLMSLFIVPLALNIIELIRVIKNNISVKGFPLGDNNLVKGGRKV